MNLFDVTARLIQALNENYDVVDMGVVLSVISTLETTQITREQLEATRLAKFINLLRRRTQDESLARRAKNLLKNWREMVNSTGQNKPQQIQPPQIQPPSNSTSYSCIAFNSEIPHQQLNFTNVLKGTLQQNDQQQQQDHRSNKSPIVIDVHDSNSSTITMNTLTTTTTDDTNLNFNDIQNQAQAHAYNSLPAWSTTISPSPLPLLTTKQKQKKHKKEKKLKERQQTQQKPQTLCNNSSMSLHDERSSQQPPNISEILSISNSSMNSNFPNERNNASSSHVDSELSFAGKFTSNETVKSIKPATTTTTVAQFKPSIGYIRTINNENSSSNSHISLPRSDQQQQQQHKNKQQQQFNTLSDIAATMLSQTDENSSSINVVGPIITASGEQYPKKRGRKKGSKGVDSVLSLDSTGLTSQMLMSSLNNGLKKVKTTKELYAEMQNRKLNATLNSTSSTAIPPTTSALKTPTILLSPSTPQTVKSATSRPSTSSGSGSDESESEDIETQTSADELTTTTMNENSKTNVNNNNRMYMNNNKSSIEQQQQPERKLTAEEMELLEKLKEMPLMRIEEIEEKYRREHEEIMCTCEVLYLQEEEDGRKEEIKEQSNKTENEVKEERVEEDGRPQHLKSQENNEQQVNFKMVQVEKKEEEEEAEAEIEIRPKKSLFDIDFSDEEEDPLLKLKEEYAQKNFGIKDEEEVEVNKEKIEDQEEKMPLQIQQTKQQLLPQFNQFIEQQQQQQQLPAHQTYKITINEDENCLAKRKYETLKKKLNKFHIKCLHDYYIDNINGNWNQIEKSKHKNIDEAEKRAMNFHEFVVPNNDQIINDSLPKTFADDVIKFTKNYKINQKRQQQMQQHYINQPFLGVSNYKLQDEQEEEEEEEDIKKFVVINNEKYLKQKKIAEQVKINEKEEDLENIVEINTTTGKEVLQKQEHLVEENLHELVVESTATITPTIDNNIDITANIPTLFDTGALISEISHQKTIPSPILVTTDKGNCREKEEEEEAIEESTRLSSGSEMNYKITKYSNENIIKKNSSSSEISSGRSSTEHSESSSNSTCSEDECQSLEDTQQSINMKLKQQRLLRQQQQQKIQKETEEEDDDDDEDEVFQATNKKRKKNSKKYFNKNKHVIKRIKIAFNGDIATQRQISYTDNENDDNDDVIVDNDVVLKKKKQKKKKNKKKKLHHDNADNNDNDANNDDDKNNNKNENFNKLHNVNPQESYDNDNDDDDDDNDDYDNYNNDDDSDIVYHHEVINNLNEEQQEHQQHHIKLTIKKTLRKSTLTPISFTKDQQEQFQKSQQPPSLKIDDDDELKNQKDQEEKNEQNLIKKKLLHEVKTQAFKEKCCRLKVQLKKHLRARLRKHKNEISKTKQHKKLFFRNELYPKMIKKMKKEEDVYIKKTVENKSLSEEDEEKIKHREFLLFDERAKLFDNMSSCSSSCADETSDELEAEINEEGKECLIYKNYKQLQDNTITKNIQIVKALENLRPTQIIQTENSITLQEYLLKTQYGENEEIENNNNLCKESCEVDEEEEEEEGEKDKESEIEVEVKVDNDKECNRFEEGEEEEDDDYNYDYKDFKKELIENDCEMNSFNKIFINNNNVYKSGKLDEDESTELLPNIENITGILVNEQNEQQQFKEWHQVLQLKSYNNEILTVMPYVVID